jgi:hypothetical protein
VADYPKPGLHLLQKLKEAIQSPQFVSEHLSQVFVFTLSPVKADEHWQVKVAFDSTRLNPARHVLHIEKLSEQSSQPTALIKMGK